MIQDFRKSNPPVAQSRLIQEFQSADETPPVIKRPEERDPGDGAAGSDDKTVALLGGAPSSAHGGTSSPSG